MWGVSCDLQVWGKGKSSASSLKFEIRPNTKKEEDGILIRVYSMKGLKE